jgi:hypothetical protein
MSAAITEEQIEKFVKAWFLALDRHVSREEVSRFLADTDLEMLFPGEPLRSLDEFAVWYQGGVYANGKKVPGVINIFFDEQHNVVSVESTIAGDQADLDIVAAWTTLWIVPPEPATRRVSLDSFHRWRVRASDKNAYGLEIVSYKVDLQYAPGSARLM